MTQAFFLFAHQDDECGVFQSICAELASGSIVHCCYFTSGTPNGLNADFRNLESRNVLLSLGVEIANIHFIGSDCSIPDGHLIDHVQLAYEWISSFLKKKNDPTKIYLPAWEGGHPDHDALHAAGVIAAEKIKLIDSTLQYPLYNGSSCFGPLFRTLLPLPENGDVKSIKIPIKNRLRFLGLCLRYPSQIKTWIGLFPFFLLHYFFWGTQDLQGVSLERLCQKPHAGSLYYERRKFSTWRLLSSKLNTLKQSTHNQH